MTKPPRRSGALRVGRYSRLVNGPPWWWLDLCPEVGRWYTPLVGSAGSISLGPLSLPIWLLVSVAALGAGLLAARIPLRGHRRLRARITDLLSTAVVVFAAAWKLTPALLRPRSLVADPLSVLIAMPGLAGLAVGACGAALYLLVVLLRRPRIRRIAVPSLLLFAGVSAALLGVGEAGFALGRRSDPAPAFTLPALGGGVVSLEGLAGKVVVLNFWATWCPPCRAELPELAAFAQDPSNRDTTLLAVNLTNTESSGELVRQYVAEHELPFTVLLDSSGQTASAYGVSVVPTTLVLAPGGRIVARRSGAVDASWLRRETRRAAATSNRDE